MRKEEVLLMIESTISRSEKGLLYLCGSLANQEKKKGRKYRSIDLLLWINPMLFITLKNTLHTLTSIN